MPPNPIFDRDLRHLDEVQQVNKEIFNDKIRAAGRPVILKGIAAHWPAIAAARESTESLATYLTAMDVGASVLTLVGAPRIKGRYFYADGMKGFNFDQRHIPVKATIKQLVESQNDDDSVGVYAGASPTELAFPGFGPDNTMPLLADDVHPKLWIGNSASIAPHIDFSENIACLVSGRRRFILFPPEQVENLYVGPLDHTMAGQPASLVNLRDIDEKQFPKFSKAIEAAYLAELEPGDAIYIPSLWWHGVESEGPFNVLVNYWWGETPHGSPMHALALALLSIRDLPPNDKAAWESMFKHYIFDRDAERAADHIPAPYQSVLGADSASRTSRIKAFLRAELSKVLN